MALAGPPMVTGELVTPLKPHSFLVLGDGTQGLGLEGCSTFLPRSSVLLLGQVILKVTFVARAAGRELPLLIHCHQLGVHEGVL